MFLLLLLVIFIRKDLIFFKEVLGLFRDSLVFLIFRRRLFIGIIYWKGELNINIKVKMNIKMIINLFIR